MHKFTIPDLTVLCTLITEGYKVRDNSELHSEFCGWSLVNEGPQHLTLLLKSAAFEVQPRIFVSLPLMTSPIPKTATEKRASDERKAKDSTLSSVTFIPRLLCYF